LFNGFISVGTLENLEVREKKFLFCLSQKDFGFWLDDALLFIKRVLELCRIVFLMKLSQPLRFFNASNQQISALFVFELHHLIWGLVA